MTRNEEAVSQVLAAYEKALNGSDTESVMPLYAEDGIFMPPYSPSAVGKPAVKTAYEAVFRAIKLTVTFHIAEVVEMSPEWVYARTNSSGTTLNHMSGESSVEANQELFLFRRNNGGEFKIARYCFATTNPPK